MAGENTVLYRDNQEIQAEDFLNDDQWTTQSIDDVVSDAILGPNLAAYSGFTISQAAQTQVSIAAGRLYVNGPAGCPVYVNSLPTIIDLYNTLPVSQQTQVAIVAWGSTIQQNIEPRNFIVDATTGQSQPQSVAMEQSRYANIGIIAGVESSSPTYPTVPATDLLIGYVLLSPTGIVSTQQETSNIIDSVEDCANRIATVESFVNQIAGQVATLATALASIAAQFKNYVLLTEYQQLVTLVAQIWQLIHQPTAYAWFGTDTFQDGSATDGGITSAGTSAGGDAFGGAPNFTICEGLRFPGSGFAPTTFNLGLNNVSDPTVLGAVPGVTDDDLMLPMPSGARNRLDCSYPTLPWLPDLILQYGSFALGVRKLTPSRHRHRCGLPFLQNPTAQVWWYQAQVDPTYHILSFPTETWELAEWSLVAAHSTEDDPDWPQHAFSRLQYFWHDNVDMPYWGKVPINYSPPSCANICQTFLNSQDGWLTSIMLYTHTNLFEPLTIAISICDPDGTPNATNVVTYVALAGADVQQCYSDPVLVGDLDILTPVQPGQHGGGTGFISSQVPIYVYPLRIQIPPAFLQAGQRYGIHLVASASGSNHSFSISNDFSCFAIHQGIFWVSGANGLYPWPGGTPKSLRFQLWFATWGQWQGQPTGIGGTVNVTVQMQSLSLQGGIGSIDILADAIIPSGTSLSYQVQIGGVWTPLNCQPNNPQYWLGNSGGALLPFSILFQGTTDEMPAVSLTNNQVILSAAQGYTFHHISSEFILPVDAGGHQETATEFQIIVKLSNFQAAHHTCACSLYASNSVGAGWTMNSASSGTAPVVSPDVVNADGSIIRTWTFTIAASMAWYIIFDGTQDSAAIDRYMITSRTLYVGNIVSP